MKNLAIALFAVISAAGLSFSQSAGAPAGKKQMTAGDFLKIKTPYIEAPDIIDKEIPRERTEDFFKKDLIPTWRSTVSELPSAKELALTYLERAAQKSPENAYLFRQVAGALNRSQILRCALSGRDFTTCVEKDALAFAYPSKLGIYLCRKLYGQIDAEPLYAQRYELAQILIHEARHCAGDRDECSTTKVEIAAMMLGAGGVALHTSYVSACGLPKAPPMTFPEAPKQ